MSDNSNKHESHSPGTSPRVPRHATQVLPEELTPERRRALKVPLHATQVLPDVLLHAKEELHSPAAETNFVIFEKHLLANHIGSLGDCMIYEKDTHHDHAVGDEDTDRHHHHSQTTPQGGPKPKVDTDRMKQQSGSFDMAADVFYTDH